jgi:enoyl-CoA hydratase
MAIGDTHTHTHTHTHTLRVAVGAGLCLALTCDVRYAAEQSRMGLNFLKLGIHPGMGATHFLPMLVGQQQAARLMYGASLVGAAEALRIGLVAEVLPTPPNFMDAVMERAHEIANASPIATRLTVQTLRNKQNVGLADALFREADAQALCYAHTDLREGLQAVIEKRQAKF